MQAPTREPLPSPYSQTLASSESEPEDSRAAVILAEDGGARWLWRLGAPLRKAPLEQLEPWDAPPSPTLQESQRCVREFMALQEGDRVRARSRHGEQTGTLVEKCRFGALIMREDRSVLAVGFQALSPLT